MSNTRVPRPSSVPFLSRRLALTGLAAGAGAMAVGTAAQPVSASTPSGSRMPQESSKHSPSATHPPTPAADPTPGAMQLFDDAGFNFSGLFTLGSSGMRSADVGEVLTAVNAVNAAGLSEQTYTDTFRALADRLVAENRQQPRGEHDQTERFRALRASNYYAQALFYVLGTSAPGDERALYLSARRAWEAFAKRCTPAPVTGAVPCGNARMPVWLFRPDASGKRRPTVILTNGSDGQNVDMWTYGVLTALERGWNALVYDGPGQGEMLFVHEIPFSPRWERVVGPLVDWLTQRPDVDGGRIALTGLSMGGNLTVRAAAFEHRIAALVTMPGVVSPWLAFPPEQRELITDDKEETNRIWNEEVVPHLPPEQTFVLKKRYESFSAEALRQVRQGLMFTDVWTPSQRIIALDVADVVHRVKAATLVLDYEDEQFYPGQPRDLYERLRAPKEYVRLTAETGAQLHCSPMAPEQHCTTVFDWLEDTLGVR